MNNRSLETTLTGLIPTLTGPIPRELVEMAASLLTLSRQRVASLKPEEESARAYLCAHIACERLRVPLDLPLVEPRPPLPKRQYNLLHTQFSNALPAPGTRPSSPTKKPPPTTVSRTRRNALGPPQSPQKKPRRNGPSSPALQPATITSTDPISTLVVRVCTHPTFASTTNPTSPPPATIIKHTFTATKAIQLSPPTTPIDTINAMASLAALYILTTSKLSGKEITGEVYTRLRGQLCSVLEEVSDDWGCAKGFNPNSSTPSKTKFYTRKELTKSPKEGPIRVKVVLHDIDEILNTLMTDKRAVDWLVSVPIWSPNAEPDVLPQITQSADEQTAFEPWVDPDEVDEQAAKRWRGNTGGVARVRGGGGNNNADHSGGAGIGRMLQDRVDYLSEKKRKGYVEWEQDVLKRAEEIEKDGAKGARGKAKAVIPMR